MSDHDGEERPATTKSKNLWGRIGRSTSHDDVSGTSKSPGFFRKQRVDSYGELVAPALTTPVHGTRKKRRNERKARSSSADASSDVEDDFQQQQQPSRRRRPFQRRHTATLSSEDASPKKSSLFSLKGVGRKRREKKAMRESGCKSDGDSVDLAHSDCSSIADPILVAPKRVGFKRDSGPDRAAYNSCSPFRGKSVDSRPLRRASESDDDFFEAHSHHLEPPRQPTSSFDSLPPAPRPAPQTIDSMPLFKQTNSFDSAPPATTTITDYGYGDDMGGGFSRAGHSSSSGNALDSARPRSASDFNSSGTLPANTTRRARGQRAQYNHASSGIKKKFRVRPYHCFPEATQMTEEEIYANSMEVSKEFVEVQSYLAPSTTVTKALDVSETIRTKWGSPNDDGRIGSLRIEVLGCIGLSRTKPDVSAYVICGDGAFCTDVLTGYRSPMWPSVARRACVFPVHHAYAKVYVGVFDCRIRKTKENDFFCGRVSIDIGSLRPNTEYDTTLPLRASTFVYDKRKRGVIRVRMSVHWFDERSAILSYFPPVRSIAESAPLLEGQPTIPCADPKTFRNVALTIYGQDLPGKYSKSAFKATMREFNLYQQNLNHFVKTFFVNLMLYERPVLSLYCLATNMYCVSFNSVRMVPAFFVGFLLIALIRSYLAFVEDSSYHLGYKPISIPEVLRALGKKPGQTIREGNVFESLSVEKRTKRRKGAHRFARMNSRDESESQLPGNETEAEEEMKLVDHREFPFSDRDAYPKFSVEEALANSGGTSRLHGRLSIYYSAPIGEDDDDADGSGGGASDSDNDDDETVTESMGDSIYDLDSDADAEDDDEMQAVGADHNYKKAMMSQADDTKVRQRLRLGPPQDADVVSGKKVPPQLQLKKVENLLYKSSLHLSVERVDAPVSKLKDASDQKNDSTLSDLPPHLQKKMKKLQLDDFDKLLGLRSRSGNPVNRIMGSFMGPLMRMMRVPIYLARVMFHVTTWRDPYLTFWVFLFLIGLFFLLIIFPWRMFFLVSSVLCLGPQNILVRRYLIARAQKKKLQALEEEDTAVDRRNAYKRQTSTRFRRGKSDVSMESSNNSADARTKDKRGLFNKRKQKKPTDKLAITKRERQPFCSEHHKALSSGKKLNPRGVAIPYSRLKKDRFFDWPPDPTVSRATAIDFNASTQPEEGSLGSSLPDVLAPAPDGLRQRKTSNQSESSIPSNIAF